MDEVPVKVVVTESPSRMDPNTPVKVVADMNKADGQLPSNTTPTKSMKKETETAKGSQLPNTGQESSTSATLVGLSILLSGLGNLAKKRKKS